ncbi:MAG: N-acetylmannosamine-6-phosphate 2-epimerase / N-acetylmannosamine kinase [Fimbriimonadaceae bacterium]|nr:N-acetylmannosamine-6-phosphate 2-epimerase / N-acetylmannosamine kinase [Fimbriimonadaceae bacterium]
MTRDDLLVALRHSPIVASVQASEDSPLDDPGVLLKLAEASAKEGVRVLRLQGVATISLIRSSLRLPVIGLIKRSYPDSDVYITPTMREVEELLGTGCEIIAVDGTSRIRPGGVLLADLIHAIHEAGRLAMADCDTAEGAQSAIQAGADLVGTTLAGYTAARLKTAGPDLELLRELVAAVEVPVFAEGRYEEPWQVQAALHIGAAGVVIGGALNDPVKQTRRFLGPVVPHGEPVGAFDIGGTLIRFGLFTPEWVLSHSEREPLPSSRDARMSWMSQHVKRHGLKRIGISTGGTVDPWTRTLIEAKPLIPDHVGTDFSGLANEVFALNDGLATAWGHSCLPQFAGLRVATLALGTGVGCGLVERGRIVMGPQGEYPRLNDLAVGDHSFEELLGGASLTDNPSDEDRQRAIEAFGRAWDVIRSMWMPDHVVLCGGVGLAPWLHASMLEGTGARLTLSPFGADAGLFGAAALALFPPEGLSTFFT